MQTFLPYPDFRRSAEVLDDRRLGKQRVETLQILRALHCEGYGWAHHPAVTMWRGHTPALVAYGIVVVDVWVGRGYGDTTRDQIAEWVHPGPPPTQAELEAAEALPPWLGWEPLHRSHRAALLRKDPDRYVPEFPDAPPADLPYVWPDPPAPARPPGRCSGWVVRGGIEGSHVVLPARAGEHPWVPLDARTGRVAKRARQVERFRHGIREGDLVLVPEDASLRVGRVTGEASGHDDAHRRPVRWIGTVARTALRFPAALQDPQAVFALHEEPAVDHVTDRA